MYLELTFGPHRTYCVCAVLMIDHVDIFCRLSLNCYNQHADEVPTFERTWEDRAKSLPRWNWNRPHSIGAPHGKSDLLGGLSFRTKSSFGINTA